MRHLALTADQDVTHAQLHACCAGLAPYSPIVVMVHGLGYCPNQEGSTNPHDTLLATAPQSAYTPWPLALGLGKCEGLTIGFGWSSSGTIWRAYRAAQAAGTQLAELLRILGRMGHPVYIIAHSLGARVALQALSYFETNTGSPCPVHRAILIAPAAFRSEAACPTRTEIISVLSSENTLYDILLRAAFPMSGRTLGNGAPGAGGAGRWVDLRINRAEVRNGLAQLGLMLDDTGRIPSHGFGYRRNGIWDLYRALIGRDALSLAALRHAIAPADASDPSAQAVAMG